MRTVIIGCGNLARVHLQKLRNMNPDIALAIVDIDPERLAQFSSELGISASFTSIEQMLQSFRPDYAHITTPPGSHYSLCEHLLSSQVHCLVEKPLAMTSEQISSLLTIAGKEQVKLTVNHMRSFDPMVKKARDLIKRKDFGEVKAVNGRYSFDYFDNRKYDSTSRWMEKLPGGPVFDIAPHVFSAMEQFTGPLHYQASQVTAIGDKVHDYQLLLTNDKGIFASALMNLNTLPLKNEVIVECERGSVHLDFRNFIINYQSVSALPNAVSRVTANLHGAWQLLWGTTVAITKFVFKRLDPYAGLDAIIKDFYSEKMINKCAEDAHRYLQIMEREPAFVPATERVEEQELAAADVLVTGGRGFLGQALVLRLLKQGRVVRVLLHSNSPLPQSWQPYEKQIQVIIGDIYDHKLVLRACTDVRKVFHLAAAMQGNWHYHLDTTVTGTKNLLTASSQQGVEQLIYISTLNVYHGEDYQQSYKVDESFQFERQPQQRGNYSHAKWQAEQAVRDFASDNPEIQVTIFRPGLIYGPGLDPCLNDLGISIGDKYLLSIGMGDRRLPLVYVENVVDACVSALKHSDGTLKIFNLVDNDYPTQREYIELLNQNGKKKRLIPIPLVVYKTAFWVLDHLCAIGLKRNPHLSYRLRSISSSPVFDTSEAQQTLHWQPQVGLKQGVNAAISALNQAGVK
ncbi:NAD-dependent epimerase/dehydratase family protein [Thalassotalea mangrovi]|uniref:NAD-dependent epimerase/dehydratase family protein n=1 Tax=Thalassotalea mangrovi TaxID=2572245 RepID=A0A4U1B8M5_9GAMM|nr:NAD-dependent epimerase/dehydratase family protein [Thalassotalea mangrovi]TKB46628.1 NAD-dependent epimerase/dehydratase family protein [Thalassotalea mangrovi]